MTESENSNPITPDAGVAEELATVLEDLLLVDIGGQELLMRVNDTREVIRPLPLTPVPMGPDHMLGLANIRGQIVCIIDASKISGLKPARPETTAETRFVVLRHPRMHVGIRVDAVRAIHQVRSDALPQAGSDSGETSDYSCGSMEISGRTYDVLDCRFIFH